ncbi:hypothetical protein OF83DRAFT_774518 [Amylostereum chailletii]|nr:hypothetical protein OF83DRAFT_774518 [Amylostereum chailletii]
MLHGHDSGPFLSTDNSFSLLPTFCMKPIMTRMTHHTPRSPIIPESTRLFKTSARYQARSVAPEAQTSFCRLSPRVPGSGATVSRLGPRYVQTFGASSFRIAETAQFSPEHVATHQESTRHGETYKKRVDARGAHRFSPLSLPRPRVWCSFCIPV